MSWLNFVDKIYLVNLPKRTDRLLASAKIFEDYEIPYSLFPAIQKPSGAEGLRDTMNLIFQEALDNNYKNILVFEDDVEILTNKFWFDETMNKVVEQLPENYHLCFLGGQPTGGFSNFRSPNLLPVIKFFSTQSVLYSNQGMKEITGRGLGFPIDNWFVDEIEVLGHSYCTYPILTTQRAGISDIGGQFIDWSAFIAPKYEQEINKLRSR
jgi:hypothetical protein